MGLGRSFSYAFKGLGYLLRTQRNFRIEVVFAALAIAAGIASRLQQWEWGALVLTIALVLILEAVNTAIESAVTLASPSFDQLARSAKDVSAAAVLIAAIASVAVGVILFAPRMLGR
ncbi:MAG TPA: diacylglycerol kinase family protein [Candidatus Limnocylindria bacterium]